MKREIEAKHQMPWYRAILHSMNRSKQFAFSEFETYANYLYSKNREGMKIQKARNKGLHMNAGQLSKQKVNQLAEKYRSLSFHKRKGYVRTPGAKSSAGGRYGCRSYSFQGDRGSGCGRYQMRSGQKLF